MKKFAPAFLILSFFFTLLSCSEPKPSDVPKEELIDVSEMRSVNDSLVVDIKKKVKTGDLVLRTGRDFSSEQVKDMSKEDKTYSHGGIVVIENDSILVYHVEPDFYYKKDKVRKELIDSFISIDHNSGFGLARFDLSEKETGTFVNYMETQFQNKVAFDMTFDLKTNDKMYCSEMITKGLRTSTDGRIQIEIQRLTDKSKFKIIKQYFKVPEKRFVNMEIIPIDRLYLNPACTLLNRYTYNQ